LTQSAIARGAIEKARYFLAQAENAERDPNISSARLPYIANLEAAIIWGRSTLDHLRSEFAGKLGYRRWHDAEWQRLETNPLFVFLTARREWIVHRSAESVNIAFNVAIVMSTSSSVACNAIVIRGQPWYRRPLKILWQDWKDSRAARGSRQEPQRREPVKDSPTTSSAAPEQIFYFADPQWKSKSARVLVGDYIDLVEQVVGEAEQKFG